MVNSNTSSRRNRREIKAKSHVTETKSVQVKIGTGDNDLNLKAKRAAGWLAEGHRVKVDLFLWGRYKYMDFAMLKERLERFLKLIPQDYRISEPIAKSPKGLSAVLERAGKAAPASPNHRSFNTKQITETNKSFTKRLKITRNGKVIARKPGQNHFNAKEKRSTQMDGRRSQALHLPKKITQRYINTAAKSRN